MKFLGILVFSFIYLQAIYGAPPSGSDILDKVEALTTPDSSHELIEQTIQTTSGDSRVFEIETWSKDRGQKSLMRYISPAPSAGISILSLEDGENIWAYFPDADDLRKISSSSRNGSVQGSDFSYEDMGNYQKRYKVQSVREDQWEKHKVYVLNMTPLKDSPYEHIELWVDADTYVIHQIYYYRHGKHTKTLVFKDWRKVKDLWIPFEMTMKNLKRQSQTQMKIKKLKLNPKLSDKIFSTEHLTDI